MKKHPKEPGARHGSEQPASLRQRTNGAEPDAEYLCAVDPSVHAGENTGHFVHCSQQERCLPAKPPPTPLQAPGNLGW